MNSRALGPNLRCHLRRTGGMGLIAILMAACGTISGPFTASRPDPSPADSAQVVARSGQLTLTLGEFREELAWFKQHNPRYEEDYETPEKVGRFVMESTLAARAEALEASRQGCDRDPNYLAAQHLRWYHAVAGATSDRATDDPSFQPTDLDFKASYEAQHELQRSHNQESEAIYFRFIFFKTVSLDPAGKAEARKRAEAALEQIKGGDSFIKVMEMVSEAQDVSRQLSRIVPQTPYYPKELYDQLKSVGIDQISPIIENPSGLGIFQIVESAQSKSRKTFEEVMADPVRKESLQRRAVDHQRRKKKIDLRERLYEEYPPQFPFDLSQGRLPTDDQEVLLRVGDQMLTFGELRQMADFMSKPLDPRQLEGMLRVIAEELMLFQEARSLGWLEFAKHDPIWVYGMRQINKLFLTHLYRPLLGPPTEEEIVAEYEKRKQHYRAPELADARQLTVTPFQEGSGEVVPALLVYDEAKRLQALIQTEGNTFDSVVGNYLSDPFKVKLKRWDKIIMRDIEFGDLRPAVILRNKVGQVQDPVRLAKGFAIYALTKRYPVERPTLDDKRDDITKRLVRQKMREATERIADEIKANLEIDAELAGFNPPPTEPTVAPEPAGADEGA
jgi:hypothetical protein